QRRRAAGGGRAPHQPRHLALSRGAELARRRGARGEGEGHFRVRRPLAAERRARRLHEALSLPGSSTRTFVLFPLAVIAFQYAINDLRFEPWFATLLVWGYLQYYLVGR